MTVRLYVRVSTNKQEFDGQLLDLQEAAKPYNLPVETYPEKVSAANEVDRPQYDRLLRDTRPGDVVLAWSLDRFSRAAHFTSSTLAVLDLERKGVRVVFLKDPLVSTPREESFGRDVMLAITPVIAKWEVIRTKQRINVAFREIKAGRRQTKSGKPLGRPVRVTDEKAQLLVRLRDEGMPWGQVAIKVGLPKGTCRATYSAIQHKRWKWRTLETPPAKARRGVAD